MPNLLQFFPETQNMIVCAHAQACPRIQLRGPVRALQCQTCRSSFLKIQQMFYAHAQTLPKIQPHSPVCSSQYQTCRSTFLEKKQMVYAHAQTFPLSNPVMSYEHAQEQICPRIQPRGPLRTPQITNLSRFFPENGMRKTRLLLLFHHLGPQ